MQKISSKLKIYLYSAIILTAISVALFTLALFFSYDTDVNYFESSSIPATLGKALAGVSVVWFLTAMFLLPKNELDGSTPLTLPVVFPSTLMAVISVFCGGTILFAGFGSTSLLDNFEGMKLINPTLLILCGIFTVLSAIYFIFNCLTPKPGKSQDVHALSGFVLPMSMVLFVAISYFDTRVSMNAPAKLCFHLSLIAFMFWFLCELRVLLKKPKPRMYLAFGLTAMLLSALASIPWLIAFFAGKVSSPLYPTYIIYNVVSFGIFAYTTVRLCVFVSARSLLERIQDQTPPEIEAEPEATETEAVAEAIEPEVAKPDQPDDEQSTGGEK